MTFIENTLVSGDIRESKLISRWAKRLSREFTNLTDDEQNLLGTYVFGYYLAQKAGYFASYRNLPYFKFLKLLPPIPQVVNAADLSTRVGRELLDEANDYQHILDMGMMEKSKTQNVRALANLLSGLIVQHSDNIGSPSQVLPFGQIKDKCIAIINNWNQRN